MSPCKRSLVFKEGPLREEYGDNTGVLIRCRITKQLHWLTCNRTGCHTYDSSRLIIISSVGMKTCCAGAGIDVTIYKVYVSWHARQEHSKQKLLKALRCFFSQSGLKKRKIKESELQKKALLMRGKCRSTFCVPFPAFYHDLSSPHTNYHRQ